MTTLQQIKDAIYAIGNRITSPIKARLDTILGISLTGVYPALDETDDVKEGIRTVLNSYGADIPLNGDEGEIVELKTLMDSVLEEESLTVRNGIETTGEIFDDIKAAITAKGVDMTGVKPSGYAAAMTTAYVRNPEWISMPEVLETDEKFVSLFAVDPEEKNLVAIRVQGAFTVDWGDGVVENFVSNTTATHNYVYSNLSNDTITSDGYKQVVMIVTPQVGQHITAFYVVPWPTLDNHVNACYNFLDIVFSLPSATMDFYGNFNRQHLMRRMESFIMMSSCVSISMYTQFANCYELKRIVLRLATMPSDLASAFINCRSLVECSLFIPNTSPVRTDSMFRYCSALEKVFLSSVAITTAINMFEGCVRLTSAPLLDTSLLTNGTNMFYGCYALKSIPLFNLGSLTNGTSMFTSCPTLKSISIRNIKVSWAIISAQLEYAALKNVIELSLFPGVTAQTFTITGNPGAAEIMAAITAGTIIVPAGWTVAN